MTKVTKSRLLLSSMLIGCIGFTANAQTRADDDEQDILLNQEVRQESSQLGSQDDGFNDQIVVTGTRLRRAIPDAPVPTTSIDTSIAFESGFVDLGDFLSDVPALQGSQVPSDTTGAVLNAAGLTLLDLRDLGVVRTLTLIDGQRQVGSLDGTAAVNINTIPQIAIERTDVITGGSSAVYGSDAVSGVVNFVTRSDYEGVEFDANYNENEFGDGDSYRLSAMAGSNFDGDRGNALFAIEHRDASELLEKEVDFFQQNGALLRIDTDTDNEDGVSIPDGDPNFGLFTGLTLDLINNAGVLNLFTPNSVNPNGNLITTDLRGNAVPFNLGRDPRTGPLTGSSATLIGGDGPLIDEELVASLLPDSETTNILTRITYDLSDNVDVFLDGRYSFIRSQTSFQPSFFSGSPNFVGQAGTDDDPRQLGAQPFGVTAFTAVDNPFLPAASVDAINGAFGVAALQRFQAEFNRQQDSTRELFRFVGGLNVDLGAPITGAQNWEASLVGNFSRSTATNRQLNVRLNDAFFAGADAIRINQADIDRIAENGGSASFGVGDTVCRVQYLQAAGLPTAIPGIGAVGQNVIDNCVPFSVFQEGGIRGDALDYVAANLNDRFEQEQGIVNFNLNGGVGDLWGAGETLFSVGAEWREEKSRSDPDELALERDTFANVIQPSRGEFDVAEVYGEVEVPIISEVPFIESLSVGGAARYSDYSTIGDAFTWTARGDWRPVSGLAIQGGFSKAVRAPNNGELFSSQAQTFVQITDPCDAEAVLGADNLDVRRANCLAAGLPENFQDPNPNISNSAFVGGNPGLNEESSDTYFIGASWEPSFLSNFIVDVEYFNIQIEDVITTLPAQTIVNNCFDDPNGIDNQFCATFERDPANGNEIANLNIAGINAAFLEVEGIDFQAAYRMGLADILNVFSSDDDDLGDLRFNVLGTYLLDDNRQDDEFDDTTFDSRNGQIGRPDWRFRFSTVYENGPLALTYRLDLQDRQDVFDENNLDIVADNPDLQSEFRQTRLFDQHDFTAAFEVSENFVVRGGVINAFDEEPDLFQENDIFDLFGRRYFLGFNAKL